MQFPGRIRSHVTEEPRAGVDEHAVREEAVRRLARFGAVRFHHADSITRFEVERSWAGPANPLRFASGGAFRVLPVPDGLRIDYRLDLPLFTLFAWTGLAVAAIAAVLALATLSLDPFVMVAAVFAGGTLGSYALNCSHANDLFKSSIRRAKPPL